jgi:two-component system LytT family response regulator
MTDTESRVSVLIVDDEPLARDSIRLVLERLPDVTLAGEAANAAEAVEAIEATSPDIVLLDVRMPDGNGFDVIDGVGAAAMPAVIFVTAFDSHAIRAFEVHAIDYVLKPFDDERIVEAVGRAPSSAANRAPSCAG